MFILTSDFSREHSRRAVIGSNATRGMDVGPFLYIVLFCLGHRADTPFKESCKTSKRIHTFVSISEQEQTIISNIQKLKKAFS
jgi:hypothetical protein